MTTTYRTGTYYGTATSPTAPAPRSRPDMKRDTTQTGIPTRHCETCGYRHPITRKHCATCGKATLFCHPGAERK